MFLKKFAFSGVLLSVLNYAVWGINDSDLSKVCFQTEQTAAESPTAVATSDSQLYDELGPSLSLIQMFSHKKLDSLPEGLKEYVGEFFSSEKYNPHDCFSPDVQKIEFDEELSDILCKLIRNEQEHQKKGDITLYHGFSGDLFFTSRYLAEFFRALTKKDVGRFILRPHHLYAKNPKTGEIFQNMHEIQKFYKSGYFDKMDSQYSIGDYGRGIDTMTLRCNIALSAGPNTSKTTASSVGFMCQSFSVEKHKIFDIVSSALVLQGMSITDAQQNAAQVEDFYQKTFGAQDKKNGGILAISIPKKTADDLALHVHSGGKPYDLYYLKLFSDLKTFFGKESVRHKDVQYALESYSPDKPISEWAETIKNAFNVWDLSFEKIQELEKILQSFLDSRAPNGSSIGYLLTNLQKALSQSLSDDDLKALTNEITLYLHPKIKMDILGFSRHMLSPTEQQKFDTDLQKLAKSHAELILNGNTKPVDGAFLTQRLKAPSEDAPYQVGAIPFLLEYGRVEEAKEIARQNPKFYEDKTIKEMLIAKTLKGLNSGFKSILDCIKQMCGESFFSLLPPEHFNLLIREAIESREKYQALDHLLKFGLSESILINIISSMSHTIFIPSNKENYLNKMLEKRPLTQNQMEEIILHGDPMLLVPESITTFIRHGFSVNPNEEEGKRRLKAWLEICKKHQHLARSIVSIIEHYKLTYKNAKELYTFLANEQIQCYVNGVPKVNYEELNNGCKVKIDELPEVVVPFGDLDRISYFDSQERINELVAHLSQRLGRSYSYELIEALTELKQSVWPYDNTFSLKVPENHKWLNEFKKVNTLDEAKKLVYELDDLNILLLKLHLLDNLPEVQQLAESEFVKSHSDSDAEYQKGIRENIVNDWFIKILKEYKTKNEENKEKYGYSSSNDVKAKMFHDMLQQGLPLYIATTITDKCCYCLDLQDVLDVWSRVWKYNPTKLLNINTRQISKDKEFFNTSLEREHPELLKNKEFVLMLFRSEVLPQSILSNKTKLKELFLMLDAKDQEIATYRFFYSNNEALNSLAKEMSDKILYPGTSFSIKEAISIFAEYGLN